MNVQIEKFLNLNFPKDIKISNLGLVNSKKKNTLTFLDDENYISSLLENKNIIALISKHELVNKIKSEKATNIYFIIVDEPRFSFYNLYNYLAKLNLKSFKSIIHNTAKINPTAYIASNNVIIGKEVEIGPNSSIMENVEIGDNVVVGSNTTLGCEDAEIKRTEKGYIKVVHDGKLIIENNVDIGSGCTIDLGFKEKDTLIKEGTVISNYCMIAHSTVIGMNCLILQCIICGSAVIGDNVRVSPGAVVSNQIEIGDNAEIGLGSIVVKNVKPNSKLSGYYAIDHKKFLYKYVKHFGKI